MQIKNMSFSGQLIAYADDLTLVYHGREATIERQMNEDLIKLNAFSNVYSLVINEKKTNYTIFNFMKKYKPISVKCGQCTIEETRDLKLLGVTFSGNMKFDVHLENISNQISRKVGLLSRLRHSLDTDVLNKIYKASIEPVFRYCSAIWSYTYEKPLEQLVMLQKKAARLIMFQPPDSHSEPLFKHLRWTKIESLWKQNALCVLYRVKAGKISERVSSWFKLVSRSTRTVQCGQFLAKSSIHSTLYMKTLFHNGINDFNDLPIDKIQLENYNLFKSYVKRNV